MMHTDGAACHVTHDDEETDRLNNVRLTYQRPTANNMGFTGLCEVLGRACADKVSDWLCKAYGLQPTGTQVTVAGTGNDVISLEAISRPEHVNEVTSPLLMHPSFKTKPDTALTTRTGIYGMAQDGSRISKGSFFS